MRHCRGDSAPASTVCRRDRTPRCSRRGGCCERMQKSRLRVCSARCVGTETFQPGIRQGRLQQPIFLELLRALFTCIELHACSVLWMATLHRHVRNAAAGSTAARLHCTVGRMYHRRSSRTRCPAPHVEMHDTTLYYEKYRLTSSTAVTTTHTPGAGCRIDLEQYHLIAATRLSHISAHY